ncbi:MAG: YceI family protein [Flavobacteriaceae bacterium]|nr:YceI family protein [Flavobacteriaceae bacterium]
MKKIIYALLFVSISAMAQDKYLTKTGTIGFEASVPSFEEVAATNQSVTAILNSENGEIAALALVKGFRFKNALMEEHFNENYAESDEFPKAIFKGKLKDFSLEELTTEAQTYILEGTLSFHGVTQEFNDLKVDLKKTEKGIDISGEFIAKASEFNIEIPKIVRKKVKDDITVSFNYALEIK